MENLEYKIGDVIKINDKEVAYIQHLFKEPNKVGVSFYLIDTPWDALGWINSYLLGDGVIKNVTEFKIILKEEYPNKENYERKQISSNSLTRLIKKFLNNNA
jgi:hypothetical protein